MVVNTTTTSTLLGIADCRVSPTLKQDLSPLPPPPAAVVAKIHDIIHHGPGLSTPSIHHGDKEEVNKPDSREMDLDEDEVMIIPPPMTSVRVTPPNPITKPKSNAEHDNNHNNIQTCEPVDEPPRMELESSIVKMQRRSRRRQVRRGSTPLPLSSTSPPPPVWLRKVRVRTRMMGVKRGRDEYEENSPTTTEYPVGRVSGSVETEVDGDNNSSEGDNLRERKDDDVLVSKGTKRRRQVVTDGSGGGSGRRQQVEEIQTAITPLSNANRPVMMMKEVHTKASGRWTHNTHNSIPEARPFTITTATSTFTSLPPSPQDQRPVPPPAPPPPAPPAKRIAKLGINHMDLVYKTEKEKEIMICRICL